MDSCCFSGHCMAEALVKHAGVDVVWVDWCSAAVGPCDSRRWWPVWTRCPVWTAFLVLKGVPTFFSLQYRLSVSLQLGSGRTVQSQQPLLAEQQCRWAEDVPLRGVCSGAEGGSGGVDSHPPADGDVADMRPSGGQNKSERRPLVLQHARTQLLWRQRKRMFLFSFKTFSGRF